MIKALLAAIWLVAAVLLLAPLAISTAAAQGKTFVRDDLAQEAARLEERLRREARPITQTPAQLVQAARGALTADPRRALALAETAARADGGSVAAWMLMARAALAIEARDWRERWELRERATAAAYLAYQRSTGAAAEAAALALLGEIFTTREMWRPALTVYRLSLVAAESAPVRATYERLRAERGFRLIDNKVDNEAQTPRACFIFSEPLARGRVDYQPFVTLAGGPADMAVSAEDRQLCVEGLRHGERYQIRLRAGIPSSIPDEVLLRDATYDIYVRDRSPAVRFTGRNYVLPRLGQQGIPVVSINTDRVEITIARIGERNLVPSLEPELFRQQLTGADARRVAEERGQPVWRGSLEVQRELNRDVTTAFPIGEAVGTMQPGVYVMTAQPAGAVRANEDAEWETRATQWFVVSDLGLASFSGPDGVHVLVRSLATAEPLAGVALRLLARNNEVLGEARTDAMGHARFDPGLARGTGGLAPALVQASREGDHNFLDLRQSAFDLTDRGVKGRVAPAGLDAFVATERGVYRSGETVYGTVLLRDARGAAVTGLPLTLIVTRPDGVEYRRLASPDEGQGGRAFAVGLVGGAAPGLWRLRVHADARAPAIGETSFLVEDYIPEKLEVTLTPERPVLGSGDAASIAVDARFLYGAPGAGLSVGGEVTVRLSDRAAVPGLEGYRYGLTDEPFEAIRSEIEEPFTTDAQGRTRAVVAIPAAETTRAVEAEITLRVGEPGGRALARSLVLPILPAGEIVGVRPLFAEGALGAGGEARFDVVAATADGRRLAREVQWVLHEVRRNYQWILADGRWSFEPIRTTRKVADGRLSLGTDTPGRIAVPVDWGSYRLDLSTPGAATSISFAVGYGGDATADTPDTLDVSLDKAAYAAGETLRLRIAPRFAGKATVAILGDRLHALRTVDVPATGATVDLPVEAGWTGSLYATVFAYRPLDVAARRMPGRALGLAWFSVDRAARTLDVAIEMPAEARPRQALTVPVRIAGLRAGETAHVTIAAVDAGILNLTRHPDPDPAGHVFGQRQLAHELRDLYGQLIDGMQGTRGAIRAGGDGPGPGLSGEIPRILPVAFFSGVLTVDSEGRASTTLPLPAFNGRLRVMAVAWSGTRLGRAATDVTVRDPVVISATVPRFLAVGDRSALHLAIDNVEGPAGDYELVVDVRGPVQLPVEALNQRLRLTARGRAEATIPVTATGVGGATVSVALRGVGAAAAVEGRHEEQFPIRAGGATLARRTLRPLDPGGRLVLGPDLVADLVPGTGSVSVAVSPFAALDLPALLARLDRYPYGCTEQVTSRAMALLHAGALARAAGLVPDGEAEARATAAVETVLARQDSSGAFGLWRVGGDDLWLDAFVTDFITRARERRVPVPATGFQLAVNRLSNSIANMGEITVEQGPAAAYALYTLARNGRSVMGDLRYLADNRLDRFPTALARAQLAAALALQGDRPRAERVFLAAVERLAAAEGAAGREDYGSRLRDTAGVLALLAETGVDGGLIQRVATQLEQLRNAATHTSTQEDLWLTLAAVALHEQGRGLALAVNGQPHAGSLARTVSADALEAAPLTIENRGERPVRAVVNVMGQPIAPEPAADRGYRVERQIFRLDGTAVPTAPGPDGVPVLNLRQNDRVVVLLRVREPVSRSARLLVVDPVPAGLEIENPRLTAGAATQGLAWLMERAGLADGVEPAHTEARDDRFVAAFDRQARQPQEVVVAYLARAVTPGSYTHPAALAEDMYAPARFGRTAVGRAVVSRR